MKIRINQLLGTIWIVFLAYISYQLYLQHIGGSGWGLNTEVTILGYHPYKLVERYTHLRNLDHYTMAWINMTAYGLSMFICISFVIRKRFSTQLYILLMLLVIIISTLNLKEVTAYDFSNIPYLKGIYSNSLLFHSGLIFIALLSIMLAYVGSKSVKKSKR